MNKMAENSVAGLGSFTERMLNRITPGMAATAKDITENSRKGMEAFGERFEEKHEFKQWEEGTKERFPETMQSMQETGEFVENMAPLTATGLVAEAEPSQAFLSPSAQQSTSSNHAVRAPVVSQEEQVAAQQKETPGSSVNAKPPVQEAADIGSITVDVVEEKDTKIASLDSAAEEKKSSPSAAASPAEASTQVVGDVAVPSSSKPADE